MKINLPKNLKLLGAIAGSFGFVFSSSLAKAQTTETQPTPELPINNGDEINSQTGDESTQDTTSSSLPPTITEPQPEPSAPVTQLPVNGTEDQKSQIPIAPSLNLPSTTPTPAVISQPPLVTETVKILTPKVGDIMDNPSTSVIVQFPLGSKLELRVNGQLVDTNLVGRTENNTQTNQIIQTWYGVVLNEGQNVISAQIVGSQEPATTVRVFVRGAAKKITIKSQETRIPADGRSTATIQGQLLDQKGNLSKQDAIITLRPSAGEFIGADFKPDQPGFQVQAKAGEFQATLRSDMKAQTVTIRANTGDIEGYTQLQLETALRPSLVTGVIDFRLGARGTDYYSRYRDFLPTDGDNGTEFQFYSAVFATGKIGEWLFTGAYNSSRTLNEDVNGESRLFRAFQFNDQTYPVYGDSSTSTIVTPSQDSLFLRLERSSKTPGANPDYFMWGDYNTEEFARTSQQFTAITRQLHGFKANYNIGNLEITGFYSANVEGFQRDTIAPDGTSGFYFLSQRILIPGSENIFVELEELNRPGTVVKRQALTRGIDYDIDYDRGTILFRNPILRTDIDEFGQILVRRIVATYQYDSRNSDGSIYGGRLQYNLSRGLTESWIGATYFQENQGLRDFELYGADTQISLGSQGKLLAEYARSRNDSDVAGNVTGQAYRAEIEGQLFTGLQGRAYYRTADPGFANNATISFVPGQTRYGAQINGRVTNTTNIRLQYDHEDNFGIAPQPKVINTDVFAPLNEPIPVPGTQVDNSLTTIMAGVQQRLGKANIDLDWIYRDRTDRINGSDLNGTSQQLRSRLTYPLADNLTFLAQNETTLSANKDAVYPDRTIFGVNWQAIQGVNISLTQQYFNAGQYSGNSITSLNVNGEHKLGSDTTITGRYSIIGGANEMTSQGAVGINNRWAILPGLRLNLAYEHVFGNFFGRNATGQQYAQPYVIGQAASSMSFDSGDSYSIGLDYTDNPNFKAGARYEFRNSSSGSNTVISAAVNGKLSPALTALVRYQQANSANQTLVGLGDTANLKVGLAYRDPRNDKFNALLRYEYRQNPTTIPDTLLLGNSASSQDHTFATEAIYAPNWQWEFYGKYALRNSTSYLAKDLVGTSTVNLGQLRVTYRLGYNMDLVGEGRVITQGNYTETGFVLEAGYYLTPNLRLSAGYAFGEIDDRDFSGVRSAGGPYVGLTVKLNELFDGFGLQKVAPPQQQESLLEPVISNYREQ
ncbi:MAG: TonB-dependent receptor [Nostocales cyanobacterium]|nr:MAG: TonB-dependent receptor [Nostocales cyanobacterium]